MTLLNSHVCQIQIFWSYTFPIITRRKTWNILFRNWVTNKYIYELPCVCVSLISTHSEKTTTTSWCLVNLQPFFLIVFTENRLIKLILSAVEVAPNRKPKTLQPPCPKYVWRSEYYFFPLILITITSNEALRLPSWRII